MRVLIARILTAAVATQAASESLPKASCSSDSETQTISGTVLLQVTGAVDKRPAPVDEEVPVPGAADPLAELQKGSKDLADIDKKPKIAVDNFDFGSGKNNDNNDNNNLNNMDDIILDNNNDIDIIKGGSTGKFDFGDGPIKTDAAASARAAADGLKRKVEKAVSKASTALQNAADNERAIRAALDDLMSSSEPSAEDLKKVSDTVKPRLVECERNFQEAQKQLIDLKIEVSSGNDDAQGAARADCVPDALLLACMAFSGWFLHLP